MALFYQSGRVSRFAVGTPGFSTNRDLTLNVSGAIGIETTKPRGSIDTPEISIRGPIIDSGINTGGLGYFLSQDVEGVKWVAASPEDLTFIRVFEDNVQVGVSSFSGLNFISNDSSLFDIKESPIGPNIADINFNTYWIRTEYGNNAGISTGYGPDGTYASLPGYGTSEAVGVTSVGIGTDNPQDDFQVGIGSTGVTINGPEGKLEAEIIKAKNLELDGNITVRSLVVDPGIATFRGNIDAQGISSFTGDVIAGFATIQELYVNDLEVELFRAGVSTLGFGQSASSFTIVENSLEVQGAIGTFINDLYVGNDLYVAGDTFFNQINAENIQVTGIATLNNVEGNTGIFTSFEVTGITTLNQLEFNTGVGTDLQLESSTIGVLTATDVSAGVATIGFANIDDANISGIVTVTEVDVEEIDIERAQVGILTITEGLSVTGTSTFVGLVTVTGDAFIDGDLTVTDQFTVQDLGAENLEVTGIGTIVNLESNVGIITTLFTEGSVNTGVGTFNVVEANDIQSGTGTIGGVGFESGRLEGTELDFDIGRIGILTGDLLSYGIGTFRDRLDSPGISNIAVAIGNTLNYDSTSQINGVTFGDELVDIFNRDLRVTGITTFTGVGTFGSDLYVKEDLFVGGELSFEQLTGTNLQVLGIATVNQLDLNTGIGTFLDLEFLQVGVATITNLLGTISTITRMDSGTVAVTTDPGKYPTSDGQFYADRSFIEFSNALDSRTTDFVARETADIQGTLEVVGLSTFDSDIDVNADINVSGLTTTNFLFAGVGTILLLDTDFIDSDEINAGIITTQDLVVTGSADFQGDVVVDIGGTANITNANIGFASVTEEVVGTSTVGFLSATDANIGVATVGLLSATDAEIEDLEVNTFRAGIATVGFGSFGTDPNEGSLYVTGINTFVGFTTFTGEVYVDGDLTVSGITTFKQLDAEQSQIGILTTKTLLDSNGLIDAENVAISTNLTVSGLTTLTGFTTTSDVIVGGGLTVVGDTTFLGIVSITDTLFVNQEITGIATVNNLNFNVGVGSTLSVGFLTATDLYVAGVSTFVGVGTFQNDLYVSKDLFVERNIVAAAISAENYFASGVSTFSNTIIDGALGVTSSVGIAKTLIVGGDVVVGGGITFEGDTELIGNVNVLGIATFNELNFDVGVGNTLTLEDLNVNGTINANGAGVATIGGSPSFENLTVTGITTLGFTTVQGNLNVTGDLIVGDDIVFDEATLRNINVSGLSSLNSVGYNVGIGSTLTIEKKLTVEGYTDLKGEVRVGGASTFVGFATFQDGLSVLGNLNVTGDIVSSDATYGDLTVTNTLTSDNNLQGNIGNFKELTVTDDFKSNGTATLFTVGVQTVSISTELSVSGLTTLTGEFEFNEAEGYELTVEKLNVNADGEVNLPGVAFTNKDAVFPNLEVIGVSTFKGFVDVNSDVDISGITTIGTNIKIDGGARRIDVGGSFIQGASAIPFQEAEVSSGKATFTRLIVTNNSDESTFAGDVEITGELQVSSASTFASITAQSIDSIGSVDIGDNLTVDNNLEVKERTDLKDLYVSGIASLNGASFGDGGEATFEKINVTGLSSLTSVSVSETLGVSGLTTMTDLNVSGVATIGLTSTTNLQFTNGDGYELEVYSLTVPTGGFVSLPGIPVSDGGAQFSELKVTGVSTFSGIATFSDSIYVNGDLVVEGNQVFSGISGEDINVTGILTTQSFNVGGASTFVGVGTFQNDLYVADDLFVKRDLLVGGAATVGTLTATDARFQNVIVDGNLTGASDGSAIIIDGGSVISGIVTIGPASITLNGLPGQEIIEIGTGSGNVIAGLNTFTNDPSHVKVDEGRFNTFITVSGAGSTSTFEGDLDVEGDITVKGSQVFEGGAQAQDFNVSGITTTENLKVNSESTFAGVGTFQDNLFVADDLFVARNANIVGIITAQDLNSTSDRRVKENIKPIDDALNKVTQLNGITFSFINTGTKSAGVIAQEVEAVFPDMVKGDFPKSVNYNGLIGALIESVKELKEQNEELRSRIEKLES
ncbi:baseplate wedge subunit [Synechococcus phage S-CAM7]|uniref:Peptidase S74 domain-containing protein n=1 Tax=Synechococcus phage S-CAM7 TaxID=1883368 RepID=A0A1D8KU30_9CAUD|nr:baseplate wedge subunit [Synechococcus phage S-CAM7]AOV62175.1 hypothetical protein C490910_253 [Synechococcus phage S-CAM7]